MAAAQLGVPLIDGAPCEQCHMSTVRAWRAFRSGACVRVFIDDPRLCGPAGAPATVTAATTCSRTTHLAVMPRGCSSESAWTRQRARVLPAAAHRGCLGKNCGRLLCHQRSARAPRQWRRRRCAASCPRQNVAAWWQARMRTGRAAARMRLMSYAACAMADRPHDQHRGMAAVAHGAHVAARMRTVAARACAIAEAWFAARWPVAHTKRRRRQLGV
jgi:hypothetical protein